MHSEDCPDIHGIILFCYKEDSTFPLYNRNFGTAEELAKYDSEYLKKAHSSFKFYKIVDSDLIGYFGKERIDDIEYLTTFFIRKKYRENKEEIWKFIESQLDRPFFTGQYKINTRSIRFCEKMGGTIVNESQEDNKPFFIFKFGE